MSLISARKIYSDDICGLVWLLINDNRVIKYLMKSSFADICVSILFYNDASKGIKHMQGVGEKRLCELFW